MTFQIRVEPPHGPVTITLESEMGRPKFSGDPDDVAYVRSALEGISGRAGHLVDPSKVTALSLVTKVFNAFGPDSYVVLKGQRRLDSERSAWRRGLKKGLRY